MIIISFFWLGIIFSKLPSINLAFIIVSLSSSILFISTLIIIFPFSEIVQGKESWISGWQIKTLSWLGIKSLLILLSEFILILLLIDEKGFIKETTFLIYKFGVFYYFLYLNDY